MVGNFILRQRVSGAKPPTSAANDRTMIRQICNVKPQDIVTIRSNKLLAHMALKTWTSSWRSEGSAGMDTWNAPTVVKSASDIQLMKNMGLVGPRWHGSSWQREIAESGSFIDSPADLVRDLPCVQQASYLEGGPLMWMLSLYLHVNQNSTDNDDDSLDIDNLQCIS